MAQSINPVLFRLNISRSWFFRLPPPPIGSSYDNDFLLYYHTIKPVFSNLCFLFSIESKFFKVFKPVFSHPKISRSLSFTSFFPFWGFAKHFRLFSKVYSRRKMFDFYSLQNQISRLFTKRLKKVSAPEPSFFRPKISSLERFSFSSSYPRMARSSIPVSSTTRFRLRNAVFRFFFRRFRKIVLYRVYFKLLYVFYLRLRKNFSFSGVNNFRFFFRLVRFPRFFPLMIAKRLSSGLKSRFTLSGLLSKLDRSFSDLSTFGKSDSKVFNYGFRLKASGRFSRRQMAETQRFRYGQISTSTVSKLVDYVFFPVTLKNSTCGLKIWIQTSL